MNEHFELFSNAERRRPGVFNKPVGRQVAVACAVSQHVEPSTTTPFPHP
jgi:hypothetical protein